MKLYTFFRSSAAYRARIALNLKGLAYNSVSIHLSKDGGLNKKADFRAINPQMRVPALALDNGETLIQSLAIIEYLDETHPEPPFLPRDAVARAKVRAVAQIVACDIHPLNNISQLRYLKDVLGQDQARIDAWYHHWVNGGFDAIEALIQPGPYSFGAQVTLADICLVPQLGNARRYGCDLAKHPTIVEIEKSCMALPAFADAAPEKQPDAE